MAYLDNEFDPSGVDTSSRFEAIPIGDYEVIIVASDVKTTKNGQGRYIKLEMDITKGAFKGKKLWANVNIINPSTVAQAIAKKFLARLCKAVGVKALKDTVSLHNKPFVVKVNLDKDNKDRNVVDDVVLDDSAAPVQTTRPVTAPAPAQTQQKTAGSRPAWQRNANPATPPATPPAPVEPAGGADEGNNLPD